MRKLDMFAYGKGEWWFWLRRRNIFRVACSFVLCSLAFACPLPQLTSLLLRLAGMRIGKNAFIAMGNVMDFFYPELVEIGGNAIIGYGCVITAHELLQGELRTGRITIGSNAVIGTRSVVLPGVEIGNSAVVGAMSLVNCDVPAGAFYAGVPIRKIK